MKKHWQNALSISLAFIVLTSFFQNCGKPIQNLEETASNASTGDNNDSNCEIENISIDAYENDILLNSNELKLNSTINFNIISRYRLTDIEWRIEQGLGETVAEAFNNDNINYNFTQAGNYNVYVVGKDSSCTRVNKAASFVVKAAACAATSPIDFSINPSSGPYSLGSSVVLSLQNPSIYKTGSIKWKIFKEVSNNSQTSLVEHAEVSQQTSFNASSYLNAEAAFQIQVSAELNQSAPSQ